jgi:hypothetical protein
MEGDRDRFLPPDDDAPDDVQCPECGAWMAWNEDGYHECINEVDEGVWCGYKGSD